MVVATFQADPCKRWYNPVLIVHSRAIITRWSCSTFPVLSENLGRGLQNGAQAGEATRHIRDKVTSNKSSESEKRNERIHVLG